MATVCDWNIMRYLRQALFMPKHASPAESGEEVWTSQQYHVVEQCTRVNLSIGCIARSNVIRELHDSLFECASVSLGYQVHPLPFSAHQSLAILARIHVILFKKFL